MHEKHEQTSPRKYIMWENIILNTNPKLLKDCSLIISSFLHVFLNAIHKYTITMKEMKRKTLNFDQENKQQSNLFLFKIKYQKGEEILSFLWLQDHLLLEKILKSVYEILFVPFFCVCMLL